VPPNNWDALTYHLPRVAAWAQEGGIHWIDAPPRDNLNEYPRLAEQQVLYLFAATGKGVLFGLPQYLAQLAILAAVFGIARRLGFELRASACSAALVTTLSLFALEAPTAQNDLVTASFVVAAACLILGGSRTELLAAGAAVALSAATKLTVAFAWPVLLALVLARGRRAFVTAVAAAAVTFAAVGLPSMVQNLDHTGRLFGHGGGRVEVTASPAFPGSLQTGVHMLYRLFDASVLSNGTIAVLATAGLALGLGLFALGARRGRRSAALLTGGGVALVLLAPALALGGEAALDWLMHRVGLPLHPPGLREGYHRVANAE